MKRSVAGVALVALLVAAPAFALPPPPVAATARAAAETLYGSTDVALAPLPAGRVGAVFPSVQVFAVVVGEGMPGDTHTLLWDGARGYDATHHFGLLLAAKGVIVVTAADAARVGAAWAEVANAEVQARRHVTADAVAQPATGGFDVVVPTWSPIHGVAATWSVAVRGGSVASSTWTVSSVGTGAAEVAGTATWLPQGTTVTTTFAADGAHVVRTRPSPEGDVVVPDDTVPWSDLAVRQNFDGTTWVVRYQPVSRTGVGPLAPTEQVLAVADALADAGVASYAKQVSHNGAADCGGARWNPASNWSFPAAERDCVLVIELTESGCAACAYSNVYDGWHVAFTPYFREWIQALGYFTDPVHDLPAVAADVLEHEYLHVLQKGMTNSGWAGLIEGTARFSETVAFPELQTATSLWFGAARAERSPDGAGYFMRHPSEALCARSYDLALFWGYLYAHDGGIATIRRVIDASDVVAGAPPCETRIPAVVDGVLADAAGEHATFASAFVGFHDAVYARDFRWAPPEGGNVHDLAWNLPPLATVPAAPGARSLPAWAAEFVTLAPGQTFTVEAGNGWSFRLLAFAADGSLVASDVPVGVATTAPTDLTDAALAVVRAAPTTASYTLALG